MHLLIQRRPFCDNGSPALRPPVEQRHHHIEQWCHGRTSRVDGVDCLDEVLLPGGGGGGGYHCTADRDHKVFIGALNDGVHTAPAAGCSDQLCQRRCLVEMVFAVEVVVVAYTALHQGHICTYAS